MRLLSILEALVKDVLPPDLISKISNFDNMADKQYQAAAIKNFKTVMNTNIDNYKKELPYLIKLGEFELKGFPLINDVSNLSPSDKINNIQPTVLKKLSQIENLTANDLHIVNTPNLIALYKESEAINKKYKANILPSKDILALYNKNSHNVLSELQGKIEALKSAWANLNSIRLDGSESSKQYLLNRYMVLDHIMGVSYLLNIGFWTNLINIAKDDSFSVVDKKKRINDLLRMKKANLKPATFMNVVQWYGKLNSKYRDLADFFKWYRTNINNMLEAELELATKKKSAFDTDDLENQNTQFFIKTSNDLKDILYMGSLPKTCYHKTTCQDVTKGGHRHKLFGNLLDDVVVVYVYQSTNQVENDDNKWVLNPNKKLILRGLLRFCKDKKKLCFHNIYTGLLKNQVRFIINFLNGISQIPVVYSADVLLKTSGLNIDLPYIDRNKNQFDE